MAGMSYFAVVQYLAAAARPAHLAAIFPYLGWTDFYRHAVYHGGAPQSEFFSYYYSLVGATQRLRLRPGARHWGNPGLHMRGAFDAWRTVRGPKWLFIGPPDAHWPWENYQDELLAWYDWQLKGIDTGHERLPPVRYWLQGAGQWRSAADWPPPEAEPDPDRQPVPPRPPAARGDRLPARPAAGNRAGKLRLLPLPRAPLPLTEHHQPRRNGRLPAHRLAAPRRQRGRGAPVLAPGMRRPRRLTRSCEPGQLTMPAVGALVTEAARPADLNSCRRI